MCSTRADRGWSLATRVAVGGALASAVAGTLAAVVGGFSANRWIADSEQANLLRITRELADEVMEELGETSDDDDPDERAHFLRVHGTRTLANIVNHELEALEIPGARATVLDGAATVAASQVATMAPGRCEDDVLGPSPRRRCVAALGVDRSLVLEVAMSDPTQRVPLFLWAILFGAASGALFGGLFSGLTARWALRPLDDLRGRVASISSTRPDTDPLAPPMKEREIEELRRALEALMLELAGALTTARAFASEAAHELRTPLTALSAELDLLTDRHGPEDGLVRLRGRVDGLIALVERLLALANPTDTLQATGVAVDLEDVVEQVVARRSDVERIQVHCEADVLVRGDEHLLEILIDNAIDNALKFSSGLVVVEVRQCGESARVDVLDTGPGLDEDEAARAFEPFFRSPAARANGTPGHGVGLALIRRVAEAHGGCATLDRVGPHTRLRADFPMWGTVTAPPPPPSRSVVSAVSPVALVPALIVVLFAVGLVAWGTTRESSPSTTPPENELDGLCEASTIIERPGGFLVGDNEAERILFRFDKALQPDGRLPFAARVEDIEAIAPTPHGLLVVGSHGRNKKGKPRPDRSAILNLSTQRVTRADLSACSACVAAEPYAPKEGGISIEGAAWWDAALWLGLRSPLEGERALLLRMRETTSERLTIVETVELDLGGRGIRELRERDGTLWLLAGAPGTGDVAPALFRLDSPDGELERIELALPQGAEGFAWADDTTLIVVTDGDGKPGKRCKSPATWRQVALPTL